MYNYDINAYLDKKELTLHYIWEGYKTIHYSTKTSNEWLKLNNGYSNERNYILIEPEGKWSKNTRTFRVFAYAAGYIKGSNMWDAEDFFILLGSEIVTFNHEKGISLCRNYNHYWLMDEASAERLEGLFSKKVDDEEFKNKPSFSSFEKAMNKAWVPICYKMGVDSSYGEMCYHKPNISHNRQITLSEYLDGATVKDIEMGDIHDDDFFFWAFVVKKDSGILKFFNGLDKTFKGTQNYAILSDYYINKISFKQSDDYGLDELENNDDVFGTCELFTNGDNASTSNLYYDHILKAYNRAFRRIGDRNDKTDKKEKRVVAFNMSSKSWMKYFRVYDTFENACKEILGVETFIRKTPREYIEEYTIYDTVVDVMIKDGVILFDKKAFINDMKIIKVPSNWSLNDGLPMFAIKEELDSIEWS